MGIARVLGVVSCLGCKKIHFFCIFLQYYLYIWNIFRIFAAVLGIVPAITKKNV